MVIRRCPTCGIVHECKEPLPSGVPAPASAAMSIKAPKFAFGDQTKKTLVSYVLKGPPKGGFLTPSNGKAKSKPVQLKQLESPFMDEVKQDTTTLQPQVETEHLQPPQVSEDVKPEETSDMLDAAELDQALARDFKREPMPQTYPKHVEELPTTPKKLEQPLDPNAAPKKKKTWTKYKDWKPSDNPDNPSQ